MISKNSFKKIKSLKQKKFREKHQRLVVEGVRSIESIINDGALIEKIVYTQEFHSKNSDFISGFNNELLNEITENEMDQLSNSITPPGVLVVVGYPQYSMFDSNKNAIFLDRISDPGNLGTMIRTASWFGINQIILSKGCIDPFNPKVLAAAMGGHFQLEFLGEEKLDQLNDHLWIGASIDGKPFNQLNSLDQKWILVMGSEAHGIENLIRSKLNMLYSIPRIGKGESLNVGVAMGIFLSKLVP